MQENPLNLLLGQQKLWRGQNSALNGRYISTGLAGLDKVLPYKGWPSHGVIEVSVSNWGIGELGIFWPLLRRQCDLKHYIAWIAPPHIPYAPSLTAKGIDLSCCRVLFNPGKDHQILWCAEKLLKSSECGITLVWPRNLSDQAVRRLQLVTEKQGNYCILWRTGDHSYSWNGSYASIRLELSRVKQGLRINILKARGTCRYPNITLDI